MSQKTFLDWNHKKLRIAGALATVIVRHICIKINECLHRTMTEWNSACKLSTQKKPEDKINRKWVQVMRNDYHQTVQSCMCKQCMHALYVWCMSNVYINACICKYECEWIMYEYVYVYASRHFLQSLLALHKSAANCYY